MSDSGSKTNADRRAFIRQASAVLVVGGLICGGTGLLIWHWYRPQPVTLAPATSQSQPEPPPQSSSAYEPHEVFSPSYWRVMHTNLAGDPLALLRGCPVREPAIEGFIIQWQKVAYSKEGIGRIRLVTPDQVKQLKDDLASTHLPSTILFELGKAMQVTHDEPAGAQFNAAGLRRAEVELAELERQGGKPGDERARMICKAIEKMSDAMLWQNKEQTAAMVRGTALMVKWQTPGSVDWNWARIRHAEMVSLLGKADQAVAELAMVEKDDGQLIGSQRMAIHFVRGNAYYLAGRYAESLPDIRYQRDHLPEPKAKDTAKYYLLALAKAGKRPEAIEGLKQYIHRYQTNRKDAIQLAYDIQQAFPAAAGERRIGRPVSLIRH